MNNNQNFKIELDNKIVELDKIYISELGYTMIKINNCDGTSTNYNVGKLEPSCNVILDLILKNKKTIDNAQLELKL